MSSFAKTEDDLSVAKATGMKKAKKQNATRVMPTKAWDQGINKASNILMLWFWPLVTRGARSTLTPEDLGPVNPVDDPVLVYARFEKLWHAELEHVKQHNERISNAPPSASNKVQSPNLVRVVLKHIGWRVLSFCFTLSLIAAGLGMSLPFLAKMLVETLSGLDTLDETEIVLVAVAMTILPMLAAISQANVLRISMRASLHLYTALSMAIFRKSLRLSGAERNKASSGNIVNLMSNDAGTSIERMVFQLFPVVIAPIQLVILIYFLFLEIGSAMFYGFGMIIVTIPINILVFKKITMYFRKLSYATDLRVKLVNELLSAIRVIKMYAWEAPFLANVERARAVELKYIRLHGYWFTVGMNAVFMQLPNLIQLAALMSFYFYGGIFLPYTVFTAIQFFQLIQQPLTVLPSAISQLSQSHVALQRVCEFLLREELQVDSSDIRNSNVPTDPDEPLIKIEKGTFRWAAETEEMETDDKSVEKMSVKNDKKEKKNQEKKKKTKKKGKGTPVVDDEDDVEGQETHGPVADALSEISLSINRGELVAIVGSVGSGKSSLLLSLLGELHKTEGVVKMKGRVGFAPQQPWIVNASLRDNILFGSEWDADLYKRTIASCALLEDVAMLPDGDETMIGERGINISGGQKARVSLARAVYSSPDIILLDDPLAAVDAHVGNHLFDQCICGQLDATTRVLVTNQIFRLTDVDRVIVMEKGRVGFQGTNAELLASGLTFGFQRDGSTNNDKDRDSYARSADSTEENIVEGQVHYSTLDLEDDAVADTHRVSYDIGDVIDVGLIEEGLPSDVVSAAVEITEHLRHATSATPENTVPAPHVAKLLYEEEGREVGTVKFGVLKYYLVAFGKCFLISAFLFNCGAFLLPIAGRYLLTFYTDEVTCEQLGALEFALNGTRGAIDASLVGDYSQGLIDANVTLERRVENLCDSRGGTLWMGTFAATMLGSVVVCVIGSVAVAEGRYNSAKVLHRRLAKSILYAPVSFFDVTPLGRVLNRFSRDMNAIDTQLAAMLLWSVVALGTSAGALIGIVLTTNGVFAAVLIPMMIAYNSIYQRARRCGIQLQRFQSTTRSPIYSSFSEMLVGLSTVRAYGHQGRFIAQNRDALRANVVPYFLARSGLPSWLTITLNELGLVMMATVMAFAVSTRGDVSAGAMALAITFVLNVTHMLYISVFVLTEAEVMLNSVERVREYAEEVTAEAPHDIPATKPQPDWPSKGEIVISNLRVGYREGPDVLKGISLTIKACEKVGIVGRTGSGKSTLMTVLLRIVEPRHGSIFIDGIDICTIGLANLRSKVAIIPQDPVCFVGSIRFNLSPFGECNDAQIWEALGLVGLKAFVSELPDKLDEMVVENGENLSMGQRQLLSIARAILRQTRVLMLDEATASVDKGTDVQLQRMIRTVFADRTVVTIAHRLETVIEDDRIVVLSDGTIVESDDPAVLLADTAGSLRGMIDSTGSENALRLIRKAQQSSDARLGRK